MTKVSKEQNRLRGRVDLKLRRKLMQLRDVALSIDPVSIVAVNTEAGRQNLAQCCLRFDDATISFAREIYHPPTVMRHLAIIRDDGKYPSIDELTTYRAIFFDDDMEVLTIVPTPKEYYTGETADIHMWHIEGASPLLANKLVVKVDAPKE